MSNSNTLSGPHNPHGQANVTVMSGPHNPHGGFPANPPPGGAVTAGGAAAVAAAEPETATRTETVALRLSLHKAHPFSVFLVTPDRNPIQIESLEIEIYDEGRRVFTTAVSADPPVVLSNPAESHVFPFTEQQVAELSPHLKVGNSVEVEVRYLAPDYSRLTIGIIAKDSHKKLGTFIEHLFHAK